MKNFSKVYSAELEGIDAKLIEVETDLHVGLHNFTIVGLADKALSEAKERVSSALKNSGTKPPSKENRKIVVNLAPADFKKTGSHYDLAIAIGYLLATGQVAPFDAENKIFVGELSLEGKLRPVSGALSMARLAQMHGFTEIFVPPENAQEAAVVEGVKVFAAKDLQALIRHLEGREELRAEELRAGYSTSEAAAGAVDIGEIRGQESAKRALMIAAAGGHNMIMVGSPGAGKTMLAQAITSILPVMTLDEGIEVAQIYSAAGLLYGKGIMKTRPFRSPHHSASPVAVIGGGADPRPGEISLAHRGVLFLDELPEFRRDLLESLRQPLEGGVVHVSRAKKTIAFPAKFMLVAAMNPCPCGYHNDEEKECQCSAAEVFRYQKKVSGPLLDRIDIQITVPRVKTDDLRKKAGDSGEGERVRSQVSAARERQAARFAGHRVGRGKIFVNAEMSSKQCETLIHLAPSAEKFLDTALKQSLVSARGYYRILKTARTIADLEASEAVTDNHLAEAFNYRLREKE